MFFRSFARVYHSVLAIVELVFVTVATKLIAPRGAFPFVVFPRTGHGDDEGTVSANPAAVRCEPLEREVGRWAVAEAEVKCSQLKRLTVRLPAEYENRLLQPIVDGDVEHLGHIVGSWWKKDPNGDPEASPSVSFWIGSDAGYPTVGMPPGTRQIVLHECWDTIDGARLHIARFTLADVRRNKRYWVAAYCTLREDLVLTASWSGPDAVTEREGLAIIRSMRAEPAEG